MFNTLRELWMEFCETNKVFWDAHRQMREEMSKNLKDSEEGRAL